MTPPRPFHLRRGTLHAGPLPLAPLAARFSTPLYVYDFDAIQAAFLAYRRAFASRGHLVCAAVKANSNLALLARLAAWGAGFDVVSGGELERVLRAGGDPAAVVFSGVGKTAPEIDAALRARILLFNVESEPELELLAQRAARLRIPARYGLRVNPDIAALTHPHIATGLRQHKFGVAMDQAPALYRRFRSRWLDPAGISFHIGSQILDPAPFVAAARKVAALARRLQRDGASIRLFDVGGGLGVQYQPGPASPSVAAYARALLAAVPQGPRLLLEPGRSLVAPAGLLLARVLYVKRPTGKTGGKTFVILDAGSNDLIRPSLYGAHHEIVPLAPRPGRRQRVDIVGPICESGDTFARGRLLPPVLPGDLVAILDAGAYGFALASNYNTRPRPAEVALERGQARLIRRRETLDDLLAPELGLE